jgi:hypothetical protein
LQASARLAPFAFSLDHIPLEACSVHRWRIEAALDEPYVATVVLHVPRECGGDGTVPAISGRAPATQNPVCVRQQVRLPGIKHEGAYHDSGAQDFVFYAIAKIARKAKLPASQFAPSRPAGTVN